MPVCSLTSRPADSGVGSLCFIFCSCLSAVSVRPICTAYLYGLVLVGVLHDFSCYSSELNAFSSFATHFALCFGRSLFSTTVRIFAPRSSWIHLRGFVYGRLPLSIFPSGCRVVLCALFLGFCSCSFSHVFPSCLQRLPPIARVYGGLPRCL